MPVGNDDRVLDRRSLGRSCSVQIGILLQDHAAGGSAARVMDRAPATRQGWPAAARRFEAPRPAGRPDTGRRSATTTAPHAADTPSRVVRDQRSAHSPPRPPAGEHEHVRRPPRGALRAGPPRRRASNTRRRRQTVHRATDPAPPRTRQRPARRQPRCVPGGHRSSKTSDVNLGPSSRPGSNRRGGCRSERCRRSPYAAGRRGTARRATLSPGWSSPHTCSMSQSGART